MIEVQNLSKRYGSHLAVDNVSFQVKDGEILGFLGPNGAGKSTTMNIITGYLAASGGTVTIDGHDVQQEPEEAKKCVGYLPEMPPLYLDMTVEEALPFFENVPTIRNKIQTLYDVGLSYVKLGQPSTTLSGGEAQRIKLATELSRRSTGKTVYILDEPTTGLHFADVHKLVEILHKLADGGNTVIVIEHNLDVIKAADYIIDMGPEGGDGGGTVIAAGTPEEVAENPVSYTGKYVKRYLEQFGGTNE